MDDLDKEFTLHEAIKQILREERDADAPLISSEDIYDKLVAQGIEPAPQSMAKFYETLKRKHLIRGIGKHNREAVAKHGAFEISWVSRVL
jgi:hypothetical protein